MKTTNDDILSPDKNISISLHDIRNFSGIFNPYQGNDHLSPIFGLGVNYDSNDGFFVVSASSHLVGQGESFRFLASSDGLKEWFRFLTKNISPKTETFICADSSFFQFINDESISNRKDGVSHPLAELSNEERFFKIQFISGDMISAYLSLLHETTPDSTMLANFLRLVALDPITYQFLTWNGIALSAQDFIQFFKNGNPIEMLVSKASMGIEMFILGRTDDTPCNIDPAQFGLAYFSTESQYKHLPKHYSIKLTVLTICKKYAITMGYNSSVEKVEKHKYNKEKTLIKNKQ